MSIAQIERRPDHRRSERLEDALSTLNALLSPAEQSVLAGHDQPKTPVVLIMGVARCGSTLCLQWLADTGCFAYPSNMLSRFYQAPAIGAMIQQVFTEYDERGEILGGESRFDFESKLGKTRGALAPNEFWYFWRRFFEFDEIQKLDEAALDPQSVRTFAAELAAVESVLQKPLAMKAMILNWDIPLLDSILDRAVFLHVVRDGFFNAQSLLQARDAFYGDRGTWYSFKPPEYASLKELTPPEQVAGQVYFTNHAIRAGLENVDQSRKMTVEYNDLCRDPAAVFERLKQRMKTFDVDVSGWSYHGPQVFQASEEVTLPANDEQAVRDALRRFEEAESGT